MPESNFGKPSSTVGIVGAIGTLYAGGWQVWMTGTDGNLWCFHQSGGSYAWSNFGVPSSTVGIARTVGTLYAGSWQVWMIGTDGNLWACYQSGTSYAWTNFGTPSGAVGISGGIGTSYATGGGWEVWMAGTDGNLWCFHQAGSSYAWDIFGIPSSTVGIAGAIGTLYAPGSWKVLVIGSDSNLWCAEQTGSSWIWTQLTNAIVDQYYLNPKYKILSIDYAPPGRSNVYYNTRTDRGASSTISKTSFQGVSVTASFDILGVGLSLTDDYKEQHDSSYKDAYSVTESSQDTFYGPPSGLGVDHDFDTIELWLNPSNAVTVIGPSDLRWGGFACNGPDPYPGAIDGITLPDTVKLTVCQLKGNCSIDGYTMTRLTRWWDTSGVGGLTSADFAVILAADPFATNPSFNPNTIDANGGRRYDQLNEFVDYIPTTVPSQSSYSVSNSHTSTVGKGAQYTYQATVGITGGSASFFWV